MTIIMHPLDKRDMETTFIYSLNPPCPLWVHDISQRVRRMLEYWVGGSLSGLPEVLKSSRQNFSPPPGLFLSTVISLSSFQSKSCPAKHACSGECMAVTRKIGGGRTDPRFVLESSASCFVASSALWCPRTILQVSTWLNQVKEMSFAAQKMSLNASSQFSKLSLMSSSAFYFRVLGQKRKAH